tara:strand:- start:2313 stop:2549 length:237 start_codon:yes stop_codon:yes gene_type:complete
MSDEQTLMTVLKLHQAALRLYKTTSPWRLWLLWRAAGGPKNPHRNYRQHSEKHLKAAAEALGFALVPIDAINEDETHG